MYTRFTASLCAHVCTTLERFRLKIAKSWKTAVIAECKMASTSINLVQKNTKSAIWRYFGISANSENISIAGAENKPTCKTCHKDVPSKGGNTTNMFPHLEDQHPALYNEVMKESKRTHSGTAKAATVNTITSCIEKTSYYDPCSKQAKEMNKAIGYFLAKDMQSYHTVERQDFKSMVSKLNPKYSRKHFYEKEIPSLYASVKSDISSEFEKMTFYSATTDLWTSRATHPYLSYTIHFVNENWELQSFCLETVPLFDDHTGDNIMASINDIMTNWNLTTTASKYCY